MNIKSISWPKITGALAIAIAMILMVIYIASQRQKINSLKQDAMISKQNELALVDSLKTERTKSGAMETSIAGYVASEKELKNLNRELYDKVQAEKGKVISLNNALVQLRQDTTELRKHINKLQTIIGELIKIDSNTFVAPWTLAYTYDSLNFDKFKGQTTIKVIKRDPLVLKHYYTELVERTTQIDITWGQKIENKQLRVFIESKYPGFSVAQLSGVLIDPNTNPYIKKLMEKRHWFTGFGLGVSATGGFNITSGGYGLVVGPSITYNIYHF